MTKKDPYLVKLVRDRMGYLADSTVLFRTVSDAETVRSLLRAKLIEECAEYLRNPCLGELADIREVVEACCVLDLGESVLDLEVEQAAKRDERGGFFSGVGMYVAGEVAS